MDRMSVSGTDDMGSNPVGVTKVTRNDAHRKMGVFYASTSGELAIKDVAA